MTKYFRIVFEEYDPQSDPQQENNIIFEGSVSRPKDFMNFGISHEEQIKVISNAQDMILQLQATEMSSPHSSCPKCKEGSLRKHGFQTSVFHDVFSDQPPYWQRQVALCAAIGAGLRDVAKGSITFLLQ